MSVLSSSKVRTIACGRGAKSIVSKFEQKKLVVLPSFPTNDELFNALSGQMESRQTVTAAPVASEGIDARPLKILIAEDNRINQKVLMRLLSKLPCESTVVSNGLEAVRATLETHYELILMDCLSKCAILGQLASIRYLHALALTHLLLFALQCQ